MKVYTEKPGMVLPYNSTVTVLSETGLPLKAELATDQQVLKIMKFSENDLQHYSENDIEFFIEGEVCKGDMEGFYEWNSVAVVETESDDTNTFYFLEDGSCVVKNIQSGEFGLFLDVLTPDDYYESYE